VSGLTERSFSMHIYLFVGNAQQAVQTTNNWIDSLPHISQKEVYKQDDE